MILVRRKILITSLMVVVFCITYVVDVKAMPDVCEVPPYDDKAELTTGGGLTEANLDTGEMTILTLAAFVGELSSTASIYMWKDVYAQKGTMTIYYTYSAKGEVRAQGILAEAGVELKIDVYDPSGNKIRTIPLFSEDAFINRVIPVDKSEARYDDPLSLPSAGVYRIEVCFAADSVVGGVGVAEVDFLMVEDYGAQVSMTIYFDVPYPPSTPSGPTSGYTWTIYTYSTSTTDPNGDDVRYEFDWGDNSPKTITGWYGSGETASASHSWNSPGTYQVKVRAQDYASYLWNLWSDWSPYITVSITLPSGWRSPMEGHRYIVMGGVTTSCGYLNGTIGWDWNWTCPYATRPPDLVPMRIRYNITFSNPDPVTGVVYLTVPATTYVGLDHISFSPTLGTYVRFRLSMDGNGSGWLFTGTGTSPILGDVDYYTRSNNTGVYWTSPSPKAGQLAAPTGQFPSVGPDGIPGNKVTGDDGFGNGTADPPGSSILYLPTKLDVDYWTGTWTDLFEALWRQVLTTAVAYNIVLGSEINGTNSMQVGQPWEFFAGIDHAKEGWKVAWKHPKCNAYVTYVCAWSTLNVWTTGAHLDIFFKVAERLVREDCVIADIDGTEEVDITDIVICAKAFGAKDEGFGNPIASPNFNAQADINTPIGEIDIGDIVRINIDFGAKLTPNCIIRL